MKLFFVTAVMAVFATAPGAIASSSRGVDYEPSASFDKGLQDQESTFSADEMMDSEDEPVNNMFAALKNVNNRNCNNIGPNTCDNRVACVWRCSTRRSSDRNRGCCHSRRSSPRQPSNRPPNNRPPSNRPPNNRPPSSGGSSRECDALGGEAARIIAYNHCGSDRRSSNRRSNWRRECRNAAIDQCKAQIRNKTRNACGRSPNTRDLKTLQNRCRDRVLRLIGDRSEEE